MECLRVRPVVAKRKKSGITSERFDAAIKSIKEGTYTAEKLSTNFELTADQQESLNLQLQAMAGADVPEAGVNNV